MPPSPQAVEQIDKRTSNVKHYKNPDGSMSAVISGGPIHYKATQGGPWLNKRQQFAAGPGTNEWISSESDVTMRTYQVGSGGSRAWWIQFTETLSGQGVEFQVLGQPITTAGSNTLSFQDGAARTWTYTHTPVGGKMWGPPMDSTEPATTYTFNYRLLGGAPALEVSPEGDLVCGSIFRMPRSYMRGADGFDYPASAWSISSGTVSFTMDHVQAGLPVQAYPFQLDPSTTFSIAASTNDGYVFVQNSATYPPAAGTTVNTAGTGFYIYRELNAGTYHQGVGLLRFDTSSLTSAAIVSGAQLSLTQGDKVDTDGLAVAAEYQSWSGVVGDYEAVPTLTNLAHAGDPLANFALSTPRSMTLSNAAANVSTFGNTFLKLHMTERAGGAAPTGRNYILFNSFESGTNIPQLTVDYTIDPNVMFIPTVAAGDGVVSAAGGTWPQVAGTAISTVGTGVQAGKQLSAGPNYTEYVGLLRFDTSVIDDAASIISATLQIYVAGNTNPDAISVVGDYATLAFTTADYARNIGTSAFDAIAIDSFTTSMYNSIALKSPAANISKTGNTDIKIGSTNLAADAPPTGVSVLQYRPIESSSGATPPILALTTILPNFKLKTFLIHATGTSATSSEGSERYDSTRKLAQHHDGVREKTTTEMGYMAYAYPIGGSSTLTTTTSVQLPQDGGAIAIPVVLEGHMLLEGITIWSVDTAQVRGPIEFALYEGRLNASNVLDVVAGTAGSIATFTPSAASARTGTLTSAPQYVPPGVYWLAIKNNNTARQAQLGGAAAGTMSSNAAQTKTFTVTAFGSTLDLVAATWTKIPNVMGVRLNGRVFGQTTAF